MEPDSALWHGQVRLLGPSDAVGFLHVSLHSDGQTWTGRVSGSDYLLWGANLARSRIEFPSGETAEVVLRAGGHVQGLGPPPSLLKSNQGGN